MRREGPLRPAALGLAIGAGLTAGLALLMGLGGPGGGRGAVQAHPDDGKTFLNDRVRITELRVRGDWDDTDVGVFGLFFGGDAELCASMIFSHPGHNERTIEREVEFPYPGGNPVTFKQGQQIWWASSYCQDVDMDGTPPFYEEATAFPWVLVHPDPKKGKAWTNELPLAHEMPWHLNECTPKALWELTVMVTEMPEDNGKFIKAIKEAVGSKPAQAALAQQPVVGVAVHIGLAIIEHILTGKQSIVGTVSLRVNGEGKHTDENQGGDLYAKAEALLEETNRPCATYTPTATPTPSPTATLVPPSAPSPTPAPPPPATATPTPTRTDTPAPTESPTPLPTASPTLEPQSPTVTATPVPPTATPTATPAVTPTMAPTAVPPSPPPVSPSPSPTGVPLATPTLPR